MAEFEDLALMKVMAAEGRGFTALPSVVLEEAVHRYGFRVVGRAETCRVQYNVITAERRLVHPALVVLMENARSQLFAEHPVVGLSGRRRRPGKPGPAAGEEPS